jgi:hypothetical protein
MSFGLDPEEERHRSAADILMLRLGLALIDDARHSDGFEADEVKLEARVGELLESLGEDGAHTEQATVEATPMDRERVLLSAPTGEHSSDSVVLRVDGVLLEEYSSIGFKAEAVDTAELSPKQEEELRQAQERFEARMRRLQFRGERFVRVLTAEPQPGSAIQFLAAELFEDGLVIHYTFDQTPESIESTVLSEVPGGLEPEPRIRVEDDLGTEYQNSSGCGGGMQVVHGAFVFTPAVPPAARSLRISSGNCTAELPL